jgi:hypothetical protein
LMCDCEIRAAHSKRVITYKVRTFTWASPGVAGALMDLSGLDWIGLDLVLKYTA